MRELRIGDKLRNVNTNAEVKIIGGCFQQIPWIYKHTIPNGTDYEYHDADYFDSDWELVEESRKEVSDDLVPTI